jgi:hypothetical protein
MSASEPRSKRPSKEVFEIERQIRSLLAHCSDPALEGCWVDMIGRGEHYLDAALCRRAAGLPPLAGRRVLSADQTLAPDWAALERERQLQDC